MSSRPEFLLGFLWFLLRLGVSVKMLVFKSGNLDCAQTPRDSPLQGSLLQSISYAVQDVLDLGTCSIQPGMDPALHHQGLRSVRLYLGYVTGSPGKVQRFLVQKNS